uniref:Pantoate--beta-alanine ligase n=1 Tax=Craspedostauros australis TaxID=1486917 RepID=A0A7R9WRY9_9STRA
MATKLAPLVVHTTIKSFREARRALDPTLSIGFVPTMGALHDGHLSLVKQARAENDIVVASIFVNPTQFGVGEDLDKYPRQLERDIGVLTQCGVEHLFAPTADEMYGKNHISYIDPEGFDDIPEGISRPGHFRGVATIVTKLFNIVKPHRAYFGRKDAAQLCLIERIVEDLNMDLSIVPVDTMREADGLAMSSRNAYLTAEERKAAPVVHRSLLAAKTALEAAGSTAGAIPGAELAQAVKAVLESEPLVSDVQYVSVDDKSTMRALETVNADDGGIVSLACKVGSVRLIDNIML